MFEKVLELIVWAFKLFFQWWPYCGKEDVSDKVIVVSGLADGMGRDVVKKLAHKGAIIAGFDLDADKIKTLEDELTGISGSAKHLLKVINIADRPSVRAFSEEVISTYGHVDVLLSNVGVAFFSPFEEVDMERALKTFEINVVGAGTFLQSFVPHMRQRGQGKILAMSSLVGVIPFPFESIYSASKFAIEGMVSALRYEVEPYGLQVGLIEPAQVSTTFAAKGHVDVQGSSPYYERAKRFVDRDHELIKTATTPKQAANRIVEVVEAKRVHLHNQVDGMSTFFIILNHYLPTFLRDLILMNHMDILPK